MIRHFSRLFLGAISALLISSAGVVQAAVPTPVYESELPGFTIPAAQDLVVDDAGNAYVLARAYENRVQADILVAKFDPAGAVVWTRYVTANNNCYGLGLALNSAGDVWVTGWTTATDFPLVHAIKTTLTGGMDAFLMRLSGIDGAITYSTYFGAGASDRFEGIALNAADEVYLVGWSNSGDYPVTPDAYQPLPSIPQNLFSDVVVTKLNPAGDTILYSTFFGGLTNDKGFKIAVDSQDNIIFAGWTEAIDFPLLNPVQSTPDEIFVAKLSADGSSLMFSTYLGGGDLDYLTQIALDAADQVYLVGFTRSENFPTTPGAYQETFVGAVLGCEVPFSPDVNCEDIFVTKLATDPGQIVWSTYLGGTTVEKGRGIAVDAAGYVYVTGYTGSADFPPSGIDFGADIIVSRFDPTGSRLNYTYLVESGSANRGNGIAVDANSDIFIAGTLGVPASVYVAKLGGTQVSAVDDALPPAQSLARNYPNPFNPRTTISFTVARAGAVQLQVFDAGGNLVRRLIAGEPLSAGQYEVPWAGHDENGRVVPSGVYFYRLDAAGRSETKRMVLLK